MRQPAADRDMARHGQWLMFRISVDRFFLSTPISIRAYSSVYSKRNTMPLKTFFSYCYLYSVSVTPPAVHVTY